MQPQSTSRSPYATNKPQTPDRFWSRVGPPTGDKGCREWRGWRSHDGLGYGYVSYRGKRWYTHRLAWFLAYGPIPDGMKVLHKCDNRACCRPDHLFLGTQAENMVDMTRKGRRGYGPQMGSAGESHPAHKLTEDQVREIRRRHGPGVRYIDLAREYGVRPELISFIVRRVAWKHIP